MKISSLFMIGISAGLWVACASPPESAPPAAATQAQEIPVTSKSPEAIELFKKGRALVENVRNSEAALELNHALSLDPDFASARAYLGLATPGAEGLKLLEDASAQAANLPDAERLMIDATLAGRRGEFAKATAALVQLTEKVPNDWRAHATLGQQYASQLQHAEAVAALKKATALNQSVGSVYNTLGYESLRENDIDGAVAAFKQYASLDPNEPNAQDSLGEALLAGGKFDEAAAAFAKALALSPSFFNALEGTAYTSYYRADWKGGDQALAKARAAALRPNDRRGLDELAGFAALARGAGAEAITRFDAIASGAEATPNDTARASLGRATVMFNEGRYRDAMTQAASAIGIAESGKLPPAAERTIARQALSVRVSAEAKMNDAAAAEKTVLAMEGLASSRPDDPFLQSALHYGRGMLAVAKKDPKTAVSHFAQCIDQDFFCRWQEIQTAEASGGGAAAQAARDRFLRAYQRDPIALFVRSKLSPARGVRATS